MNLDAHADLLKSRGCDGIWYFHADHFEPWSYSIDERSAKAVAHMGDMARLSPFSRRMNLFYSVFVPYRLELDDGFGGIDKVPGDGVAFGRRSERQRELASAAMRPLVQSGAHELHLHVHHEYWTRNAACLDAPVSRWVNTYSTREADSARLDLFLFLCREAIEAELGAPFGAWAFVHGNWALNASDPDVCHVEDEIALLMRHGALGDFSFPAGRRNCDPKLAAPFTCLPLPLPRVYDDPRGDAHAVAPGGRTMTPDRFLIWNSPIKAPYCSLDYYSPGNRSRLKEPDRMLQQWLGNSVVLDRTLFLKTHAHSMKEEYKIGEPGSLIPHCYPDTVALFDHLQRVCDRARVALRVVTVTEVLRRLHDIDGTAIDPTRGAAGDTRFAAWKNRRAEPAGPEPEDGPLEYRLRAPFAADGGAAWSAALPAALMPLTDDNDHHARSDLELLEDGRPLGPGHEVHRAIRDQGKGGYSFWKDGLWFSTSDGTDPNDNGRRYSVVRAGGARRLPRSLGGKTRR